MMGLFSWEYPWVWWLGLPVGVWLFTWYVLRRRRDTHPVALGISTVIRAAAWVSLLAVLANPVGSLSSHLPSQRDRVVALIDSSASMAWEDVGGGSRYQAAVDFMRRHAVPSLQQAGLGVEARLFDEASRPVDGPTLAQTVPQGSQTNLARAIAESIAESPVPPLALLVVTDGITTATEDNARAAHALLANGVPFIGVGVGSDHGPRFLALRAVSAPPRVPPSTRFPVEATMSVTGSGPLPPLTLLLLRDGKLVEQKNLQVPADVHLFRHGFWIEEAQPGRFQYTVRLVAPDDPSIQLAHPEAAVGVTVSDEQRVGILFVQGGLTWDYKFIQIATRSDPILFITALSRTSTQSRFLQSVGPEERLDGLPRSLDEFSRFRVIVLANVKPEDFPRPQQELLLRFVGEYGGGLLMLGGGETLHPSWADQPLARLLPIRLANTSRGFSQPPYAIRLTPAGARHPIFRIADDQSAELSWQELPRFSEYAITDAVKAGAEVWAERQAGDSGSAPLMVSQRYGLGRVVTIGIANLWRWRLAKQTNPQHFDRFWQQLFHYLADSGRGAVSIHLADTWLAPRTDLHALLEWRATANQAPQPTNCQFQVQTAAGQIVSGQQVTLLANQPTEVTFRVDQEGTYHLRVLDSSQREQGNRTVEIKPISRELLRTGRDMESLRQWAQLSRGLAVKLEDCRHARQLVEHIRQQAEQAYQRRTTRKPAGVTTPVLLWFLALLSAEWALRRWWQWT